VLFVFFFVVFVGLWGVLTFTLPPLWRGFTWIANRAGSTAMRYGIVKRAVSATGPFREYLPVAIIVLAGVVISAVAGDGFLDLAELVHERSPALQEIDAFVHDWAIAQRNANATAFFDVMSTIGGPGGLAVILLVASVALGWQRRFRWLAYVIVTVGGGALLDAELKRFFARSRPDVALQLMHASGYSFPSGHAMGSTVAFATLSYLAFRVLPRWWQRAAAVSFASTMILSIALSRVYLGVHWISDVTAGIVCGLLWVTVTTAAYETLRRIRAIRAMRLERSESGPTGV
jgi:membrane-associated phospholipid phosphatase